VANCSRYGPERGVVDTDRVYADEGTIKSVELKPEEVNDVEDGIGRSVDVDEVVELFSS
jgi:hypothetical protein